MSPKVKSFLKILAQVGPLALALHPATAKYAPKIIELVGAAEKLPGASGPDKKAFVMAALAPLVLAAATKKVKGFEQPDLALTTISAAIDTTIGVVGILQGSRKIVTLEPVVLVPVG